MEALTCRAEQNDAMNIYNIYNDVDRFLFFTSRGVGVMDQVLFSPLGQKLGEAWRGLHLCKLDSTVEGYPGELPAGDFVGISASQIGLTPKAVSIVGEGLKRCGELLPVTCPDHPEPLLWFHPTAVIDALDVAHSEAKPILDSGRLFVTRHGFFSDHLRDALVFRVPQDPGPKFCTDTFKSLVQDNGLTGLRFQLAWSDEPAGIARLEKSFGPMPGPATRLV